MASETAKELISQINTAQGWGLSEANQEAYATWLDGYLPEEATESFKRLSYYHANQPFIAALLDENHPGHEYALQSIQKQIAVIVAKQGCPASVAADIIQQTLMLLLAALPTFRHESSLKTWVHIIATNEAKAYFRQRSRADRLEKKVQAMLPKPEPTSDPTHEQISHSLLWENIYARLKAESDPRLETVFVERALHDRRFCDIKDALGLSISRTYTLYKTACTLLSQDPVLRRAAAEFGLSLQQASTQKRKKNPPAPPTDMREDG